MTSNFVTVTGIRRAAPAEFDAQWNGRPLSIRLDMSATLRLMGNRPSEEKLEVLSSKVDLIAEAAQRLLDMRIEKPKDDDAIVTLTALDLDDADSPSLRTDAAGLASWREPGSPAATAA